MAWIEYNNYCYNLNSFTEISFHREVDEESCICLTYEHRDSEGYLRFLSLRFDTLDEFDAKMKEIRNLILNRG